MTLQKPRNFQDCRQPPEASSRKGKEGFFSRATSLPRKHSPLDALGSGLEALEIGEKRCSLFWAIQVGVVCPKHPGKPYKVQGTWAELLNPSMNRHRGIGSI